MSPERGSKASFYSEAGVSEYVLDNYGISTEDMTAMVNAAEAKLLNMQLKEELNDDDMVFLQTAAWAGIECVARAVTFKDSRVDTVEAALAECLSAIAAKTATISPKKPISALEGGLNQALRKVAKAVKMIEPRQYTMDLLMIGFNGLEALKLYTEAANGFSLDASTRAALQELAGTY